MVQVDEISPMEFRNMFILHNTIAANDLVTQGARASAAMLFTYFSQNIPPSAPDGLFFNF